MIARLGLTVALLAAFLAALWACAALWFDGPTSRALAGALTAGFALATLFLLVRVRPWPRALGGFALLFALVLGWWLSIPPEQDREWQPDVARTAHMQIDGDRLTVENVRHFAYRTEADYTERWETRTYDLSQLQGADLFLSYWGSPMIAHTFVSWDFGTGPPLTISIETRKEVGEAYSAIRGFFRQFELYYVVSDERDVAWLRTNVRREDTYLYRLRGSAETARALLLDFAAGINRLAEEPAWYNAFSHNCTTSIRRHVDHALGSRPWDWRIFVNGYLDQAMYEQGTIARDLPFEEVRRSSAISARAQKLSSPADFSRHVREAIPARPAAP